MSGTARPPGPRVPPPHRVTEAKEVAGTEKGPARQAVWGSTLSKLLLAIITQPSAGASSCGGQGGVPQTPRPH